MKLNAMSAGIRRFRTHDELTFDNDPSRVIDSKGNQMGVRFKTPHHSQDGKTTYDSTGAFLVGQLERLDMKMHEPLTDTKWGRDIDVREDVTIGDEVSSFTQSAFASAGGLGAGNGIGNGKAWIGKTTDQVTGVAVDISKIPHPLIPWGIEIKYSILELESSAKRGAPIDVQKYNAMVKKHQMDTDEQVYIGDTPTGATGLINNSAVTNFANVANDGLGTTTEWANKTPAQILADVNEIMYSAWQASAFARIPARLLLPNLQFGFISTETVSTAGNVSILKYLKENNVLTASGEGALEIYPSKWLIGAGAGGVIGTEGAHDRMAVYTKEMDYVRFPMTVLQRTPVQYDSLFHKTTYYCRLGQVECVYPETLAYRDGI